jgi:transmembrane sensor
MAEMNGTQSNLEKIAIAWYARMNGEPSAEDRHDFNAWLHADPAHEQAYAALESLCPQAEEASRKLAEEDAEELSVYLRKLEEGKARRRVSRVLPVAVLLLTLSVAALWTWLERPNLFQDISADAVAAIGERRQVDLPDGSKALLDADTALKFVDDPAARHIRLLRGRAFFDIISGEKPFIVTAGGGEVRVFGTRFDVSMRGDDVIVNLEEGRVTVRSEKLGRQEDLLPGDRVRYDDAAMSSVSKVNVADAMAWREGRYVFEQTRLADVVDEIERYRGGRILVFGRGLSDRLISGTLPLDRPEAALSSLQASAGFAITHLGGRVVILRP